MRIILLCVVLGLTLAPHAWSQDQTATEVLTAFRETGDFSRLQPLLPLISQWESGDWDEFWANYFKSNNYFPRFSSVWPYLVSQGAAQDRVAVVSSLAATRGFAAALPALSASGDGEQLTAAQASLLWLRQLSPTLAVREAIGSALEDRTIDLTRPLSTGASRDQQLTAIQAVLSFSALLGPESFAENILLPPPLQEFYGRHGVFLFDAGVLSPAHLTSLSSLLAAIPSQLHRISALTVPDGLGYDPLAAGISAGGQIIAIPYIEMAVSTPPDEFVPRVGQPTTAEFTITAAQHIFAAIQAVQFSERPHLVLRRDIELRLASDHPERYLRRNANPAAFYADPDALLPAAAYLYFIDTPRVFQMALDLLSVYQKPAMGQFLLIADVLSGGGNTTLVFRTSPTGIVQVDTAPVSRTFVGSIRPPDPEQVFGETTIPVNAPFLDGIQLNGRQWEFGLSDDGGVARLLQQR